MKPEATLTLSLRQRALRLARTDTFTVFTSSGLSSGLRLITFALLARWLSRDDFGMWVLFQTYFTLFDTVRTGFQSAFVNYAAGADERAFGRWAGAAWQIATGVTVLAIALLWAGWYVASALGYDLGGLALVGWFAALAIATVPNCLSGWTLFARAQFRPMQSIRIIIQCLFLVFIAAQWWYAPLTPAFLYGAFTVASGLVSLLTSALGWSRWRDALRRAPDERAKLWQFGRYSVGTLMVSNLLRASDTMLLGAWLGPAAVVVYHVPQRVIEVLEMFIRSTVMTATPQLALRYEQGRDEMARWFHQTAGRLWVGLLPFSIGAALLAEPLVVLLGGEGYRESATLLRIFMVYTSLLPLDRFTGIGLEAVRHPRLNLLKVVAMLVVNVVGDVAALYWFRSVEGVAVVSIATFVTGLWLGFAWLRRYLPVSIWETIRVGVSEVMEIIRAPRSVSSQTACAAAKPSGQVACHARPGEDTGHGGAVQKVK